MVEIDGEFAHTDRNTLVRVSPSETTEVADLEM